MKVYLATITNEDKNEYEIFGIYKTLEPAVKEITAWIERLTDTTAEITNFEDKYVCIDAAHLSGLVEETQLRE